MDLAPNMVAQSGVRAGLHRSRLTPRGRAARFLAALAVLVALEGCAGSDPASGYLEDPEALARGEAVFTGTCSGYCHGVNVAINDTPNLFDCAWINGGSNQDIYNTIVDGVPGSRMVAFAGRLPDGDEDIWKIVAFLKSEASGC